MEYWDPNPEEIVKLYEVPEDARQGRPLEIDDHGSTIAATRPYVWTMSAMSMDGVLALKESESSCAADIVLKKEAKASPDRIKRGAELDWLLLNTGWAYADAVLLTGEILRNEPWAASYCRTNTLKVHHRLPLQVVLTRSPDLDIPNIAMFDSPSLNDLELPVLVATCNETVAKKLQAKVDALLHTSRRVRVQAFPNHNGKHVDLKKLLAALWSDFGIRLLDVTAGGKVIAPMVFQKLVDEVRITVCGHLCGEVNAKKEGRPRLFPEESFPPQQSPLLQYDHIKVMGPHHIHIRSSVHYRH
eukprot:Clim_evm23s150 gene=Clim_evmTU23s150